MKKFTLLGLLTAIILSCVACDTAQNNANGEQGDAKSQEVVFLNDIPRYQTYPTEMGNTGKLIQQVIVDEKGATTNWFGKYIQTDEDVLYAFCVNVDNNAESTLQKLFEKETKIILDYPYTYTYQDRKVVEPEIVTDLYGEGCIAIAATLEEIALLQEDVELNLHVTEAFRSDLLEVMKDAGWSEDSTNSVVEWANSHQDAACAKLGEENQLKSSVQVEKIADIFVSNDTKNDSTETDVPTTVSKEVVFMNREGGIVILDIGYDGPILKKLEVAAEYDYEYDEENNKDTLYAFGCHFYPKGDVVEKPDYIYEDKNVYVLSDYKGFGDNYVYDMTIACTMDDLVRLFDNEEFLEKWSVHINPLMRPDILEVLKELGWDENGTKTSGDWYKNNRELVESKIGTDNQITMTVEVEQ